MRCKSHIGLLAAVSLAGALAPTVVHASPVAMAANLVGKPEYRSGGGAWKPLGVLTRLSPGDTVRCAQGQEAIVMMFTNGVRFRVASGHVGTVAPTSVQGGDLLAGMGGATIRVAKAMTGMDTQPFLARPAQSHERLDKSIPGIVADGTRTFQWLPLDDAATYSFTIFDQHDNVIWSARVNGTTATCPDDIPAFFDKRPYVWTVSGFGQSGRPVVATRWGIITFLSQEDSDKLTADVKALNDEATAHPSDTTPLLLEAELYRQYGVLEGTLETLEDQRLEGQPGIHDQIGAAYHQVSSYAAYLSLKDVGKSSAGN